MHSAQYFAFYILNKNLHFAEAYSPCFQEWQRSGREIVTKVLLASSQERLISFCLFCLSETSS